MVQIMLFLGLETNLMFLNQRGNPSNIEFNFVLRCKITHGICSVI
jgi:hypothetical protein